MTAPAGAARRRVAPRAAAGQPARPGARWPHLTGRGKLGYMSDSGTAVSVPAATAADPADPACDVAHGKAAAPGQHADAGGGLRLAGGPLPAQLRQGRRLPAGAASIPMPAAWPVTMARTDTARTDMAG